MLIYTFKKNGHKYSVKDANLIDAKATAQFLFNVNLSGAEYEEIYKTKVIKTGIIY